MATKTKFAYSAPVAFRFSVVLLGSVQKASDVTNQLSSQTLKMSMLKETSFTSVSGLESTLQTEEVKIGGMNNASLCIPSGVKYSPLVLNRGMMLKDSVFATWYWNYVNSPTGKVEKRNLLVFLLDNDSLPILIWFVMDAFPISWKVGQLDAKSNDILIEEMQLSYMKFEVFKQT